MLPNVNKARDKGRPVERPGRLRLARRLVKMTGIVALVVVVLAAAGFFRFAGTVAALTTPEKPPRADAIVVLTGGYQRIERAVALLEQGAGQRLLISGVNPVTSGNEIRRTTNGSPLLFDCCVDIGHDAIDTVGNANETARWIGKNGFRRILLVTNNYHMPRSLLELRRVDGETDYLPYPVVSSDLNGMRWYLDPATLRTLLAEYAKYALASVRSVFGGAARTGLRTDQTGARPQMVEAVDR